MNQNKVDEAKECWDADILKCCLSYENAVETLTSRLKFLQQKQLEKNGTISMHNSENLLASTNTPMNVKSSVLTDVQLKKSYTEALNKDSLPTKFDIKTEENNALCYNTDSICSGKQDFYKVKQQSFVESKTIEPKLECEHLPSDTYSSPQKANSKHNFTLPTTVIVKSLIKCSDTIDDVHVLGPFVEWMVPQKRIIETVIKALKKGGHAVLESPTGTGKTIALLCALLGYQLYLKKKWTETHTRAPVIYFATRTHSQIKQIIHELKKTPYRPSTVSLSGAARLCPYAKNLQEQQVKLSKQNQLRCMCRNAVAATEKSRSSRFHTVSRMIQKQSLQAAYFFMKNERFKVLTPPHQSLPTTECPYYATLDHPDYAEKIFQYLLPPISNLTNSTNSLSVDHGIWDIEDLNRVTLCNGNKVNDTYCTKNKVDTTALLGCPYYTAHALVPLADLVVLPYQLLLNPTMIARNRFFINDSIIVFDESHNIEGVCREEGSSVLRCHDVLFVLKILDEFIFKTTQNHVFQLIETATTQLPDLQWTVPLTGNILELLFKKLHINMKNDGHGEKLALSFASVSCIWASLQGMVQYITECIKNFSRAFPYQAEYPLTIHEWGPTSTNAQRKNGSSFFNEIGLDSCHISSLIRHMSLIYDMCMESTQSSSTGETKENLVIVQSFQSLLGLLRHEIFFNITTYFEILKLSSNYPQCYVIYLTLLNMDFDWTLTLKLMVAAPIMNLLCEKKTSILLASGTLHPIHFFLSEFGSEFVSKVSHVLEAPHIILPKQLLGIAVPNLLSDISTKTSQLIPACCNASNLMKPLFLISLGSTIVNFSQSIPGGILVVLPSYQSLTQVATIWKSTQSSKKNFTGESISIWRELEILKNKVLVEPRSTKEFSTILQLFINQVDDKGGCLLLSVFRGKFAEGFSLSDTYIRGVICVGIPFPNLTNMDIARKWKYNDALIQKNRLLEKTNCQNFSSSLLSTKPCFASYQCDNSLNNETLDTLTKISWASGNDWYRLQAFYALNQAMGRVIRHAKDYGVVILLDSRHVSNFKKKHHQSYLKTSSSNDWKSNFSKWLHPFLIQLTAEEVSQKLQIFFAAHQSLLPLSIPMPSFISKRMFKTLAKANLVPLSCNTTQHFGHNSETFPHQHSKTFGKIKPFAAKKLETQSDLTKLQFHKANIVGNKSMLVASAPTSLKVLNTEDFKSIPHSPKTCVNELFDFDKFCNNKKNSFSSLSYLTKPSLVPLTKSQCSREKKATKPSICVTQPSAKVKLEQKIVENSFSTKAWMNSNCTTIQTNLIYKNQPSPKCILPSTYGMTQGSNPSQERTCPISKSQKRSYSSFSKPSSNVFNWNLPTFSFLKKMPFSNEFEDDDIQNS